MTNTVTIITYHGEDDYVISVLYENQSMDNAINIMIQEITRWNICTTPGLSEWKEIDTPGEGKAFFPIYDGEIVEDSCFTVRSYPVDKVLKK